jgi:hypothetical protein
MQNQRHIHHGIQLLQPFKIQVGLPLVLAVDSSNRHREGIDTGKAHKFSRLIRVGQQSAVFVFGQVFSARADVA